MQVSASIPVSTIVDGQSSSICTGREFQPLDLLLLFLGVNKRVQHALPPSTCGAFEFLTMQELQNVRILSKTIYADLSFVPYTQCRDGRDYNVPFPGFAGLLATPSDKRVGAGLFPHQLASLRLMHQMENGAFSSDSSLSLPSQQLPFGALRGGVLADAPGLGKTITILALIASTAGQRPTTPLEFWSNSNVDENWKMLRLNPVAAPELFATIKPMQKWLQANIDPRHVAANGRLQQRQPSGRACHENFRQLRRDVTPPFCGQQFPTIRSFESYVKTTLRRSCGIPRGQLDLFRMQMVHLRAGLDKRNRKMLKSTSVSRRLQQERRLLPSTATLIVVPDALLEHWYQQIIQHLDLTRFTDELEFDGGSSDHRLVPRSVVYLDGFGDIRDARMPLTRMKFNQQVPSAWELSQYVIVVTSFSRCETEYNRLVDSGHLVEETGSLADRSSRKRSRAGAPTAVQGSDSSLGLLLQIRWLRLVVDEGHELGMHAAGTGATRFIHEIAAERRWVASGTPTTGNEDDEEFTAKALDQLQRLLMFLRHPTYGDIPPETSSTSNSEVEILQRKLQAKQEWEIRVKQPFLEKQRSGRDEIERVLREIMVVHRKEDIHLPKPIFEQADVDVPIPESTQLMIRDFQNPMLAKAFFNEYLHSTEYQTLVDKAQARYIVEKTLQARRALNERGGPIVEAQKAISDYSLVEVRDDRRPIKVVVYSSNSNVLLSVTEHLYRNLSFENIAEMYDRAEIGDLGMELSRFRNGFREQRTCPVCHRPNEMENNGVSVTRCQHMLLEVVAIDTQRRFLIEPERIVTTLNVPRNRMGGESLSSYSKLSRFWEVGDLLEVDLRDPHPLFSRRESEETWKDWGSEVCIGFAQVNFFNGPEWYMGPLASDNESATNVVVELAKWQKCSQFHGKWYKGPRLVDSPVAKVKEDVFMLSLDASLATGLDLSFVTHIFLLEAIDDAAMLEQITSRAHRLGATGPVVIDTVNTFWKLPQVTEQALEERATVESLSNTNNSSSSPAKQLGQDKERTMRKVVCSFCYRQFDSIAKAEDHERLTCQRNPNSVGVADPFHLSSIYESIRPPPALDTDSFS